MSFKSTGALVWFTVTGKGHAKTKNVHQQINGHKIIFEALSSKGTSYHVRLSPGKTQNICKSCWKVTMIRFLICVIAFECWVERYRCTYTPFGVNQHKVSF